MTILELLKDGKKYSATKIAKLVYKLSKATKKVKREIDELLASGKIKEDNSGRYTTYSISKEEKKLTKEQKKVFKALEKENGISATKIAKLGFKISKATKNVKDAIDELVENGEIREDNSGRYTVYFLSSDTTKKPKKENEEPKVTITKGTFNTIKDIPDTDLGFEFKYEEGLIKVKEPLDGIKFSMNPDERILFINNQSIYVISNFEEGMEAILDFANNKSYGHFSVKDVRKNKPVKVGDLPESIDTTLVLYLTIEPNNKGGI
ncbi:MAG: hypothetical protein ACOC3V_00945 [bacterium]